MAASKFNKCVGKKMRGKHFRTKTARSAAWRKSLRACGAKGMGKMKTKKSSRRPACSIAKHSKCVKSCQLKYGHCR